MSRSCRISCVIPVHNGVRYIVEAVESLIAQTRKPDEIIVVDDGSTDGTSKVLEPFREVRVVYQENAGPPAARNRGIRESSGDLIALQDADDLSLPKRLEIQLYRLEERDDLQLVCSEIQEFRIDAETRARVEGRVVSGLNSLSSMARREVFEIVGPFDEELRHAADADWFSRARAAGITMEVLPLILVERRLHPGSLSQREGERSRSEHLRLIKRKLDRQRSGE